MFKVHKTKGARVKERGLGYWRLAIPAGEQGQYRLAQMDDYSGLARRDFPRRPPFRLELQVRASAPNLPGTWGFGLWNDPFNASLGLGGGVRHLPALPNALWFFFASPPNYLSLRDDLPAVGALAASFRSPRMPGLLLTPGALALPLLALRPTARLIRRLGRLVVKEASALMGHNAVEWHQYSLFWGAEGAELRVDGEVVLATEVTPCGPLGLVLWIDNQYAAFRPDGGLEYGRLANPESWIEIKELRIEDDDD
jgi:hypothetical protein